MINGDNIKIMVGGKVVGMVESTKLSIAGATEPSTKEFSDPWRRAAIGREFWLKGGIVVQDPRQSICDLARDLMDGKYDVTIGQPAGHLPRKMKKAGRADYRRNTKWKRKLAAYTNRRSVKIGRAEVVVTHEQQTTLTAVIRGGTIGHGCEISGKQLLKNLKPKRR